MVYEAAPLPINEAARNARVHRSGVMDVHQEERYGLYVELAKMITDCPVAYTGLLDEDRQFFLAKDFGGLIDADEVPRNLTLCQYALGSTDPTIVQDLRKHPKLKHNPLVTDPPNWVFWGAYPLVTDDGLVLGTLCTVDYQPRTMSPEQIKGMEKLAGNMTLLITLQMQERDAITERMAKLAGYFRKSLPETSPAAIEAFLNVCGGIPADTEALKDLEANGLVDLGGSAPDLTASGRELQAEHGLNAATYRRTISASSSLNVEDLFAMMD